MTWVFSVSDPTIEVGNAITCNMEGPIIQNNISFSYAAFQSGLSWMYSISLHTTHTCEHEPTMRVLTPLDLLVELALGDILLSDTQRE